MDTEFNIFEFLIKFKISELCSVLLRISLFSVELKLLYVLGDNIK